MVAPRGFPGSLCLESTNGLITLGDFARSMRMTTDDAVRVLSLLLSLDLCLVASPGDGGGGATTATATTAATPTFIPTTQFMFPASTVERIAVSKLWAAGTWAMHCGRRVCCVEEVGMFTAGYFPRLQVIAYRAFQSYASVGLFQRMLRVRIMGACQVEMVAMLGTNLRSVDVWVRCGATQKDSTVAASIFEEMLQLVENARLESCEGTEVTVVCVSPRYLEGEVFDGVSEFTEQSQSELLLELEADPEQKFAVVSANSDYLAVEEFFPFQKVNEMNSGVVTCMV